jgi:hypothetical protein
MICALKALVGWLVLMLIGTNLIGLFVRGLAEQIELKIATKGIGDDAPIPLQREAQRLLRANAAGNVFFGCICLAYLYGLYHWWNLGVAACGLVLMLARLPDLRFEIKTGQKICGVRNRWRVRHLFFSNHPLGTVATIVDWLALPLLWWSLYYR